MTLEVDGRESSQPLEVLKDPNSEGTPTDIRAQTAMLLDLQADMNAAADAINQIEWVRRQLYDFKAVLAEQEDAEDIVATADVLDAELIAVEEDLIQLRLTGTGQDAVRWPAKLVGKLGHLANGVAVADFSPTDSEREVHQVLKDVLRQAQGALDDVLRTTLVEFNERLRQRNLSPLISDSP